MASPTVRASNVWEVNAKDDILQITAQKSGGQVLSGIDSTGAGFGALAGSPAGTVGDVQFNNNGVFGTIDTISSGSVANVDPDSGTFVLTLTTGAFVFTGASLIAETSGDCNFTSDNGGVSFTASDGTVQISGSELNFQSNDSNMSFVTTTGGIGMNSANGLFSVTSGSPVNSNIVFTGDNTSGHEQNIQILGANINGDFPAIIIEANGSGSINLNSPQILINGGSGISTISIGASSDTIKIGQSGGLLSFFSATAHTKLTVTGSKAGNTALASVIAQLAAYGLITDSTT